VTLALTGIAATPDSIEPIALIAKGADALAVLLAFPPIPIEVRQKRAARPRAVRQRLATPTTPR
jgi:hypothetical protein